MAGMQQFLARPQRELPSSPLAQFLFTSPKAAVLWLIVRLYLGYTWIHAGLEKINDPGWVDGGMALKGFWSYAISMPENGRPPIAYDWYRDFISFMLETESYVWFSKLVVYGEILVGIGLIIGAFVGVTALFAGFMNWNYIMAGAASTNGVLLVCSILLILAWRVAGYIGLDYFLVPRLGTPWSRSKQASTGMKPALAE